MPGGHPEAWPHIKPIFQSIAAKADGEPCCDWVSSTRRQVSNYPLTGAHRLGRMVQGTTSRWCTMVSSTETCRYGDVWVWGMGNVKVSVWDTKVWECAVWVWDGGNVLFRETHTCGCWTTGVRWSYNMPAYTNQPRVHHTLAYPPLYTVCMCVCAMYLGCVYKL